MIVGRVFEGWIAGRLPVWKKKKKKVVKEDDNETTDWMNKVNKEVSEKELNNEIRRVYR